MGRASKRTRAISIDTDPQEPVEVPAKRSRGAQPEPQQLPQEQADAVNAPARDRREVMADVARRQVAVLHMARLFISSSVHKHISYRCAQLDM